jgi:ABC-type glutathione transport system ATPase component
MPAASWSRRLPEPILAALGLVVNVRGRHHLFRRSAAVHAVGQIDLAIMPVVTLCVVGFGCGRTMLTRAMLGDDRHPLHMPVEGSC